MPYCHCYNISDWPNWFDMPDIAGCIAPRPLLVLKGENDGCFEADDVEFAAGKVGEIYEAARSPELFEYATYPGGHCLDLDRADAWLSKL
jgi:hypothetical protein